ncbi:LysR family transcriptional regulator [Glaciihabitans sp. UYNi722]|uniref:LysR family transcriptional regulator n=1 Tax=Glaciihabitans sp. UYNi722 TaxID=3156344 RepID=UPI0033964D61
MDTRQLEYFVAVAEELSFSHAAVRLFVAQSTVSAGVGSLERELGARLFDRSSKAVALTAAGSALLPEARHAIESMDRVRNAVALSEAEIRGRLRIGTFISLDSIDLPQLLGEFHQRHPLVDMQLIASPSGSTGLLDEVRQGRADVAFMGLPSRELTGLHVVELARSSFVAVLPMSHPLAAATSVDVADLAGERWIDAPRGYASRAVLDGLFRNRGLERIISAEVADAGEIPRLVAAGLGVAVIPELIYRAAPGVDIRRVKQYGLEFVVSVISRVNPTPAASAFLNLIGERGENSLK